ncbi:Dihydroorotate dehydrogenase (quinone), mitochondrial [Sparassis crispa]|uniref:Dihydroorotate dehydrogenase (quinone), mitochondrial n=1 Tax=Sparassis crispa TaxID=139825 RepID=A0A401GVI7_9APHY|nr:Dihydroorotate dehydrogenase (quinone), mitochondrial [Sparassis crispa]GBE86200.1 Dihydroorotate dehydrogenase (quinone), mitochondrial [Sparassis crispa]
MATLRLLSSRSFALQRLSRLEARRYASPSSSVAASAPWRTALYATLFTVSAGLFAVYYFDSRSALHRYLLTPVLRHALDAETAHKLAVQVLRSGLGPRDTQPDDGVLKTELWGLPVSNPVGVAAGFDKNGEAIDGLFDLGFSWVEVGSVTPKPQPGNAKPRVFRLLEDGALINRYGFPSEGHASVLARLRARIPLFRDESDPSPASFRPDALLAVNLGKNKASAPESIEDFVSGVHAFGPYADVLVVNVSSPNTPGLRGLQTRALLEELLAGVSQARDELVASEKVVRKPKLVLKIAPDLDEAEIIDIAAAVSNGDVDGVIVSNTTVQRPASLTDPNRTEAGGLSGPPLKAYTLATLRTLRAHLPAAVPIIGCGGVASGADALEYARAGAAAVQLYTSFGYDGVGACRRIKDELAEALREAGTSWAEVVRAAVDAKSLRERAPPAEEGLAELIAEAEQLKKLLDGLGERVDRGEGATAPASGAAVAAVAV